MSKICLNFSFSGFVGGEDGAITVDWVVLTSAIIGLGLAVLGTVSGGTLALGDTISQALAETQVASLSPNAGSGAGGTGGSSPYTTPATTNPPAPLPPSPVPGKGGSGTGYTPPPTSTVTLLPPPPPPPTKGP